MSLKKITKEELEEIVKKCFSYRQVAIMLGLCHYGSTVTRLRKKAEEFNIDTSHFTGQQWSKGKTALEDERIKSSASTYEQLFCENSKASPSYVKDIIIKKELVKYECAICGQGPEWNGKPLGLQMDHINGKRNDHRLENLRILCPHCHSQTDTFCAKNKKHKSPLTDEVIIEALKQTYTIKQAINFLGVNNSNRTKFIRIMKEHNVKQKEIQVKEKFCPVCNKEVINRHATYCSQQCSNISKEGMTSDPSTWVHGSTNTYDYRKCRCDLCKKANTEKKKQQRHNRKANAKV